MTAPLSNFRDIVQLLFKVVHYNAYNSVELEILISKIHDVLAASQALPPPLQPLPMFEPFQTIFRPPTPPTLVIHPDGDVGEIVPNVVVTKEDNDVRNLIVNLPPVVTTIKVASTDVAPVNEDAETVTIDDADYAETADDAETADEAETAEETYGAEMAEEADDADDAEDAETADGTHDVDDAEEADDAETAEEGDGADGAEDAETVDDAEESADEEAEEDEDLTLLKIKKQRYYWSPSSKRIYEYLEEGYGDCLGTFEDGKIIPKV